MVPTLTDRLNETLRILTNDNSTINAFNNKIYTYVMLDWRVDVWKPIMITVEASEKLLVRKLSTNATAFRGTNDADFPSCNGRTPFVDCTGKQCSIRRPFSLVEKTLEKSHFDKTSSSYLQGLLPTGRTTFVSRILSLSSWPRSC